MCERVLEDGEEEILMRWVDEDLKERRFYFLSFFCLIIFNDVI